MGSPSSTPTARAVAPPDAATRAARILGILADGSCIPLNITGRPDGVEEVCLSEDDKLCIRRPRTVDGRTDTVLLSIDDLGMSTFIAACGRLSEADWIGITAGATLRSMRTPR